MGEFELNRSIAEIRSEFPGLDPSCVPLDGAAGTLVPQPVITAVVDALRYSMANMHGAFAASRVTDATVAEARAAVADLIGGDPGGVIFGPNMTTLTFHMADALSAGWGEGDEIVVTSLDHDANVRPWVLAAERRGVSVRWAEFDTASGELPVEAVEAVLGERTRLVAVTAASNAIGTKPDVRAIADLAHGLDALVYVDGVHATPHGPIDVGALGADLYAFSTYKLFGPHIGVVHGSPALLETVQPLKLVPASDEVPDRFERGTPTFELLAGVTAAVDWLASLSEVEGPRRVRLLAAMAAIEDRLLWLLVRMLRGLAALERVRTLGAARRRTSTVSFVVEDVTPHEVATALARAAVNVWDGDNYARELMTRYGLSESGGAVRASIVLYNDESDVDRFLEALAGVAQ